DMTAGMNHQGGRRRHRLRDMSALPCSGKNKPGRMREADRLRLPIQESGGARAGGRWPMAAEARRRAAWGEREADTRRKRKAIASMVSSGTIGSGGAGRDDGAGPSRSGR